MARVPKEDFADFYKKAYASNDVENCAPKEKSYVNYDADKRAPKEDFVDFYKKAYATEDAE